jgi:hypothetical protein
MSPYNKIQELQHFASTLAKTEPQPWKISLADDVQTITMNRTPLRLDRWCAGLQEAANDTNELIADLLKGEPIPIQIPDNLEDDMTDRTRGMSWLNKGPFTEEEDPLLKRYLEDPNGNNIGYNGPNGSFHL